MASIGSSLGIIIVGQGVILLMVASDDDSITAADSSRDMATSPFSSTGTTQFGQPQDFAKLFKAERDNLEFSQGLYAWVGDGVDLRVLRKYGRDPKPANQTRTP